MITPNYFIIVNFTPLARIRKDRFFIQAAFEVIFWNNKFFDILLIIVLYFYEPSHIRKYGYDVSSYRGILKTVLKRR